MVSTMSSFQRAQAEFEEVLTELPVEDVEPEALGQLRELPDQEVASATEATKELPTATPVEDATEATKELPTMTPVADSFPARQAGADEHCIPQGSCEAEDAAVPELSELPIGGPSARRLHTLPDGVTETPNITWTLPMDETVIVVEEQGGIGLQDCHPLECQKLELDAGVNYTMFELQVSQHRFGGGDPTGLYVDIMPARLRMVSSDIHRLLAQNGACATSAMDNRVLLGDWASPKAVETTSLGLPPTYMVDIPGSGFAEGGRLVADNLLQFRMGGDFKLCYSASGTFAMREADVARVPIKVSGIYDNSPGCNSRRRHDPNCLSNHQYHCYLMKTAYNTKDNRYALQTSCVVDFSYAGAGYVGNAGSGSWSGEWMPVSYNPINGRLVGGVLPAPCGMTEPARFICQTGGACDSGAWPPSVLTTDATASGTNAASGQAVPSLFDGTDYNGQFNSGKGTISIPTTTKMMGMSGELEFKARTVAACYCPARGGCDATGEFTQQIGLLHYYLSKVCHVGDRNCINDYNGVTGQYRFRIRVECPTNACAADGDNRVKLVARHESNDLPSWNSQNGCRDAVHGAIYGKSTFPTTLYEPLDASPPGYVNQDEVTMTGGYRQDYKEFGGPFGFDFFMGSSPHERRTFHRTHLVDVCYCHRNCYGPSADGSGWFKVGGFRLSPTRLVSAATARSNLPAQWSIEFMNQPGIVGLERQYADANVLGLQENSLLKIVKDQDRLIRDLGCSLSGYNSQLTAGLSTANAASMNYLGRSQRQTPPDLKKVVFNSDAFVNTITVKEGGTIAICYCAITMDGVCYDPANWKLITHLTIKGANINKKWLFSTNVVFRFDYPGWGLSGVSADGSEIGDALRIIASDGECTANNYNPNTAAYLYTGIMVNCPGATCKKVGDTSSDIPGDLITGVLSSNTYDCDRYLTNCRTNDIVSVVVDSAEWTTLVFQHPHGLRDGEEMTLGDNIACDPFNNAQCTEETVSSLKGLYKFGDADANNGMAPDHYIDGHVIETTKDPRMIKIKIGWPDPKPKFVIVFANAQPEIGYVGRGGHWKHRSRGITKEEIKGTVEKANLRVCWRFGGNGAKYVMEVGRLSIKDPAPLTGSMISMTATLPHLMAPMILTFKTAGGMVGARYDQADDSLRLKITLTKTHRLDINYSHPIDGGNIPYDVPLEDDFEEASQSICGKLFLEMWSDDMSRGFPLPKGCYYKSFEASQTREIMIIFEAKSGPRKDSTYQLVFNGMAHNLDLMPNEEFAELATMDDISVRQYEAIEWGTVILSTGHKTDSPQVGGGEENGGDTSDPKFRAPGGMKIVGGFNDLLVLKAGDSLTFEIMGGTPAPYYGNGPIKAGQFIRIFLWPLTQWQTTSSCTAECLQGGAVSFACSTITYCKGLPTVPKMSLNILKVQTPENFGGSDSLKGNAKIQIRIGGITLPAGGFFAGRLAAQVTKNDDTRPHYVISSGDYIWKEPNAGQPVSKLVATVGGGNDRPFRGDKGNTIYARMLLSSTIFARDKTGTDASFTITLPPNYQCLNMNPMLNKAGDNINSWQAPDDLPVHFEVPQGRGTPTDGTIMHGWTVDGNTCTFTPKHPFGAVYAGSSMFVKVTVNNPEKALPRADLTNKWTVKMTNRGLHHASQEEIEAGLLPDKQVTQEFQFLASGDPLYQSNSAVLGKIQQASCQPTTFLLSYPRPVEQELRFFFRTELEVEAHGSIRLKAPVGYYFENPCDAQDLQAAYYATAANPNDATLRLPNMDGCVAGGDRQRQADIKFINILKAGRLFAFRITVQNPMMYDDSHMSDWRIYTVDASGYLVDGTPQTVPFRSGDDDSWGVYNGDITASVKVTDRRPYNMRTMVGEEDGRTYLKVILSDLPDGDSGYVRFTAPVGYEFNFKVFEFQVNDGQLPDITEDMPRPEMEADGDGDITAVTGTTALIWKPYTWNSKKRYSFQAMLKVPDFDPISETNAFFFELGFNTSWLHNSSGRSGAYAIPAQPVRALKNARLEYSTNIKAKENMVEFTLETATSIPTGGGIEIIVPPGFLIARRCEIIPVRDPDLAMVLPELRCSSFVDELSRPVVRLTRDKTMPLYPGKHAFAILMENPKVLVSNYPARRLEEDRKLGVSDTPPCGTFICWMISSYKRLQPNGGNNCPCSKPCHAAAECGDQLDFYTSAAGFSVNRKMLEARIPILNQEQRLGTERDDRPMSMNNIIFAFKLQEEHMESGILLIRAPYGFVFAEECLDGVEVSEATVFGLGNRFPPAYTSWPSGVILEDCRGAGFEVKLSLKFSPGARLARSELYLVRIRLTANPLATPIPNRWNIELGDQSSEPIEGMTLWAFTDTEITPTTTARDRTLAGEQRTPNPLKILLRPFNTVLPGGELRAEAELGFTFVHTPNRVCDAELVELPYVDLGIQYNFPSGFSYPQADLVCLVNEFDARMMSLRIRGNRPMYAGVLYRLVIVVYNPGTTLSSAVSPPSKWKISSYLPGSVSLDESVISAFRINTVMDLFSYENPDPDDAAREMRNGGTRLPSFSLKVRFPSTLVSNDKIVITSPAGPDRFRLEDRNTGRCKGLRWIPLNPEDEFTEINGQTIAYNPLPASRVYCNDTRMEIHILEALSVPRYTLIEFGLQIFNPLRTPGLEFNFWRCTLFDMNGVIKSSKAFESWEILPQLEQMEVVLLGPNQAAESMSSIRVAFTAVTDAEDLAIEASFPPNFNFNAATLSENFQSVIKSNTDPPEVLRVTFAKGIVAGTRYTVDIHGVRLGRDGGQTDFQLTTWLGGLYQSGSWNPGNKKDERLRFSDGFRLPGLTKVRLEKIQNTYIQDPLNYPVQSQWRPLMGRPAYIEFHFHLTRQAVAGHHLKVYAVPYEPTMRTFVLEESQLYGARGTAAQRAVAANVESITGGQLDILLQEPLIPLRVYRVVLSVIAPQATEVRDLGMPLRWTLETRDGGMLPSNTNDGSSREFPIVEEYKFEVVVARAPPTAEVEVELRINPGISVPTELRIVAPLGFNFSYGCLVSGGGVVVSCNPGKVVADGRATASLQCIQDGIRGQPQNLVLRVSTPERTPVWQEWFVEGIDRMSELQLGWGEAAGFEVLQMADTAGVYPAIPGVRAHMVWRFRSQVVVQAGGWLQVSLPAGVFPDCGPGQLDSIALPNSGGCDVSDLENIRIFINSTIVPGEYAFAFYVTPPLMTPLRNSMALIIKDQYGNVKDAAVGLPAPVIQDKLKIAALPLTWSSSRTARPSTVTIGFSCLEAMPDLIVSPLQQISEVLISLPVGFSHNIVQLSDFTLVNEEMPLRAGVWLDYMKKDQLRVTMDLNVSNSWTTLKKGDYAFRFQVNVPNPLPVFNVWHVSLCKPNYPGGCQRLTDPAVLINFAIPGFDIGEASPVARVEPVAEAGGGVAATGGARRAAALGGSVAWLLFLMLPFSLQLILRKK
jgi:hypothetical protein